MGLPIVQHKSAFLPMTAEEARFRGWDALDFVLVTGDAYVDHPSFANAVIGRLLEAEGYRVGVIAQPDWKTADAFRVLGRPEIAWLVSAGNLDSMLNNYTAHKRRRTDDQYSPGADGGRRPDYATVVYAQRCREAFPGVPVIAGGVEVSMRRLAHYDYWKDRVKRSMVLDSKADLVVYGMGEAPLLEIVRRLKAGETIGRIRDVRGTVYALGKKGTPPDDALELPSFEVVSGDDDASKRAFARAAHTFHKEHNPARAKTIIQRHGDRVVVMNPPQLPLETDALDAIFALPFNKAPHPSYGDAHIPAWEMVKFSVNVMRGCFGGCTFCAITEHQGKPIQSRSPESVLAEVKDLAARPDFKGVLSDLGGPTANMYQMVCGDPEVEKTCRRHSCVHPTVCKLLVTDHGPIKQLMRDVRNVDGVRKVFVASGVRMDLANLDQEYIEELAAHHVGGHLKVAPEHVDDRALKLMKKPPVAVYEEFEQRFAKASKKAKKEQYLVPYFVSSHPGCDMDGAVQLGAFLKDRNLRPRQVQDFIPTPSTPATCMWWTGIDPLSMKPVFVEKNMRGKRKQKALMQYFLPENADLVREALHETGRTELMGNHAAALVGFDRGPNRRRGKRRGRRRAGRD